MKPAHLASQLTIHSVLAHRVLNIDVLSMRTGCNGIERSQVHDADTLHVKDVMREAFTT